MHKLVYTPHTDDTSILEDYLMDFIFITMEMRYMQEMGFSLWQFENLQNIYNLKCTIEMFLHLVTFAVPDQTSADLVQVWKKMEWCRNFSSSKQTRIKCLFEYSKLMGCMTEIYCYI